MAEPEKKKKSSWEKWFGGGLGGSAFWQPSRWLWEETRAPTSAEQIGEFVSGIIPKTEEEEFEAWLASGGWTPEKIMLVKNQLKKQGKTWQDTTYWQQFVTSKQTLPEPEGKEGIPAGIRSIDGYDWTVDEAGNLLDVLGRTSTPETGGANVPQWRPGELELERQQLGLQEQQLAQQAAKEEAALMANPADWIQRWAAPRLRELIMARAERAKYPPVEYFAQQLAPGGTPISTEPVSAEQVGLEAKREATTFQRQVERRKSEGMRRGKQAIWAGPPAPSWLSEFSPYQRAGMPIGLGQAMPSGKLGQKASPTKATGKLLGNEALQAQLRTVKTPSGQLWARTPWSIRQGLAGFANWAGGRPLADIEEEMAMMQPEPIRKQRWGQSYRG